MMNLMQKLNCDVDADRQFRQALFIDDSAECLAGMENVAGLRTLHVTRAEGGLSPQELENILTEMELG